MWPGPIQCAPTQYIPTPKNVLVKDFYPDNGFQQTDQQGESTQFKAKLAKLNANYADYLEVDEA